MNGLANPTSIEVKANTDISKNTRDMVLVAQVFESGSISAASLATGLERTSLSRRLRTLERRLSVALFDRSGQRIQATDVGKDYVEFCFRVRELVNEAESFLKGPRREKSEILRIVADFEEPGRLLAPIIDKYTASHHKSKVVVTVSGLRLDTMPEDADLVIQAGARRRPDAQFYDLGTLSRSIWASPDFLATMEKPRHPSDIEDVAYIGLADPTDGTTVLRLSNGASTIGVALLPRFRLPSLAACREACEASLGFAVLPDFLCRDAEARGKVTRVIPEWRPSSIQLTAAHHRSGLAPRRIRSFIAFFDRHFSPDGRGQSNAEVSGRAVLDTIVDRASRRSVLPS